jgi:hypothetical protein
MRPPAATATPTFGSTITGSWTGTSAGTVRDSDVRIACETYTDFVHPHLEARQAEGDHITEDGLCMSMYRAIKYGCSCSSYIKNMVEPGWAIKAGSGYDLNSIMHYPSRSGHGNQKCADDGDDCPLYAYVDSNNHGEGVYEVLQPRAPSEADIMWVKRNYPWKKET